MSAFEIVYRVAVPVPLRKLFDYLGPDSLRPGMRVEVPFGTRTLVGVVLASGAARTEHALRPILRTLDSEPIWDDRLLNLLRWAADYHHHPVGEVFATGLPVKLRGGRGVDPPRGIPVYRACGLPTEEALVTLRRATAQQRLYRSLSRAHWRTWDQLSMESGCNKTALKALLQRNLAEAGTELADIAPLPDVGKIHLSPEQQHVADRIAASLNSFQTFLLQGITGSGKTEVYLEVARQTITRGNQVLFLVPEIALTPQLVDRVQDHLGNSVRCLHSGMTQQERYDTWWLARAGRVSVVLGTRSAIFTPLKHPGLIVVDEEHDSSYKQQDGFRYHARNLAIKRASLSRIPVVLGSATPSLESHHNTQQNRHQLLQLHERYGTAILPTVRIIDSNFHPPINGLTAPLLHAIRERLGRKEQTIIYVNRRGYAPVVRCYQCGWEANCPHCSVRLVYHRQSNHFRCHHCGHREPSETACPTCADPLFLGGAGTQRLEQALSGQFPGARLCRLDRDGAKTAHQLHRQLEQIRNGEVDIVIGTQLITKGHDFSRVTLVGVVHADQGLYNMDFRGTEFMFQELLQVAGRSGRAQTKGEVLVQTGHPHHPCIRLLAAQDYMGFVEFERKQREKAGYPPFAHLAMFRAESKDAKAARHTLEQIQHQGVRILHHTGIDDVEIFPPVPSPLEKKAGRYRMHVMIRARHRGSLHHLLGQFGLVLESIRFPHSVRWSLDVDPMDML